jgi:hypothetical protein
MKHIKLRDLDVSRIGPGAMGMSAAYTGAGTDDAESILTIHRALDLGVTLIDTAETYGPFSRSATSPRPPAAIMKTPTCGCSAADPAAADADTSPARSVR